MESTKRYLKPSRSQRPREKAPADGKVLTDAHFFLLALAYVGTERRNPIFSFVNCPCDQEIDLVLSIPRARICIHLVPLFNVFFDRDKKRKRIRQLARKTQLPGTLFNQA